MPNNLGDITKSVFLKEVESHKLHQEFEVAVGVSIKRGQPVKLTGAGEKIAPAGTAEANINIIGYAIMDGEAGELVTVGMRAFAIIWAEALVVGVAGKVKYAGFNGTSGLHRFSTDTVTAPDHTGWALDDATAIGDSIRVALI